MREKDASSKAVVFTQYPGTVARVCKRLMEHRFTYRSILGGTAARLQAGAIEAFQRDDRITVCGCMCLDACMHDLLSVPREFSHSVSVNHACTVSRSEPHGVLLRTRIAGGAAAAHACGCEACDAGSGRGAAQRCR